MSQCWIVSAPGVGWQVRLSEQWDGIDKVGITQDVILDGHFLDGFNRSDGEETVYVKGKYVTYLWKEDRPS